MKQCIISAITTFRLHSVYNKLNPISLLSQTAPWKLLHAGPISQRSSRHIVYLWNMASILQRGSILQTSLHHCCGIKLAI
jgi:hypothetical protein